MYPGVPLALPVDIRAGASRVKGLHPATYRRLWELCDCDADPDIGFVDAGVLAVVERPKEPRLTTLDQPDFGAARPRHADAFRLLPE